jgi:hypothetical protein
MFRSTLLLFSILVLISCQEEETSPGCTVAATVRDLAGLDGCGFVFELEDGTRLEPVIHYYTQLCDLSPGSFREAPEDPLSAFEFVDGKTVKIEYELVEGMSVCMVGPRARITCVTEIGFEGQGLQP